MKLSKDTIAILEHMALVNSAILIKPGNRLVSVANGGGILANAEVKDTFDATFGIYDLKTFLSMVGLVGEEPHLDTTKSDSFVLIKDKEVNTDTQYRFFVADQSLIKTPPKDELVLEAVDLEFTLTAAVAKKVLQACAVLGLEDIAITSTGSKLHIGTSDPKQKVSDNFTLLLADNYDGPEINIIVAKEKMNFFPGDYNCKVSFSPLRLQLTNKDRDLRYWVAAESKSTVAKG